MVLLCEICSNEKAIIKRPKNGYGVCKKCFFYCFEEEIHQTITMGKLFKKGDRVAVASSGGKDSTVLGYVMKLLNERYDYGLNLELLSIDEGITGYRDDSLESVKKNQIDYQLPLKILNYKDIYGWTMDEIVKLIGLKNNCTFCGVFRRQALDRGAIELNCDVIVTGHNADDLAETILMNVLRGDVARLKRSVNITTGTKKNITKNEESINSEKCCSNELNINKNSCCQDKNECIKQTFFNSNLGSIPRSKPFKYTYEKEIVMYAYYKNLNYFSTECIYSPNSYRGHARAFLKELEVIRPSVIIDIIHSGESFIIKDTITLPTQGTCVRCGYMSSQNICKACVMLEGLNKGKPKLGIGKSSKVELIKQVNNKKSFCRKDSCNCDGIHKKSKKQLKKIEILNKREENKLESKIQEDVIKFMNNLNIN